MVEVTWQVTENGVVVGHELRKMPSQKSAQNLVKYLKQFADCQNFNIFSWEDFI